MTVPLVVIGAGGFGREVLDVVHALSETGGGPTLLGVVDDAPSDENLELLTRRRVAHLGTIDEWLSPEHDTERYVVGVGDPHVKQQIVERVERHGRIATTLVHPRAVIGTGGQIGAGTVICAGTLVSTNVRCGAHVHLNPGSIIGHDTQLEPYCSINPGAVVSGSSTIGSKALLGAGSTVLQNLHIGDEAIVAAGAVVIRDVPSRATVIGVPARRMESK